VESGWGFLRAEAREERHFWYSVSMQSPSEIFQHLWMHSNKDDVATMSPAEVGCLQLMLVGCKPGINKNSFAQAHKEILVGSGYVEYGEWIFDPKQLRDVYSAHADIMNVDVADLSGKSLKEIDDVTAGLLLGIPLHATQYYASHYHQAKTAGEPIKGISVNVYGHCWMESLSMDEASLKYISRCIYALESSGLNDYTKRVMPQEWAEVYECSLSVTGTDA